MSRISKGAKPVKHRGLWGEVWHRFCKSKLALVGMGFLILMIGIALATIIIDAVDGGQFYEQNVINQQLVRRFEPPNFKEIGNIFGRDEFGRSMFFRVIWGTRYSVFIALLAIFSSIVVGGLLGVLAGYYGRWMDNLLMRLMDILLSVPPMLLSIAVVAALGPALENLIIAIFIGFIPNFARIVRAAILSVKDQEFVEAVKALGASNLRIIVRHIIPNAMAPVIVQATLCMASAILAISSLSYLGLGIQPPLPEWGAMLTNARSYIRESWHITVIPGCSIMLSILSLNLMGDGLRDALDPRLKN